MKTEDKLQLRTSLGTPIFALNSSYNALYYGQLPNDPFIPVSTALIVYAANYLTIGPIVSVFGMIGNIINMIVYSRHGFKDSVNVSLLTLAATDFCGLLFTVLFAIGSNPGFVKLLKYIYNPDEVMNILIDEVWIRLFLEMALETGRNDIAIVGVGFKGPGAGNLEQLWDVLKEGKNCAGLISNPFEFDNPFFNVNSMESDQMDPQQKLVLECTYRAMEHAGVTRELLKGTNTGVYIGDCSMAICGGVNIIISPDIFVHLTKAKMLSPTGQCHAFSELADGYARGEGCGVVILKKLSDYRCQFKVRYARNL
ncbi:hypothetical protein Btru_015690 [Bulinus truncatus]|nr:hypothetical protein Btru_015690 [Bulinus truncatus]